MGSPESTREKHVCASLLLVVWEVTVVFSSTKAETTFYFVSELWLISFYRCPSTRSHKKMETDACVKYKVLLLYKDRRSREQKKNIVK